MEVKVFFIQFIVTSLICCCDVIASSGLPASKLLTFGNAKKEFEPSLKTPQVHLDQSLESEQRTEHIPKFYLDFARSFLKKFNNLTHFTWSKCDNDTYQVLHDLTKGQIYALRCK